MTPLMRLTDAACDAASVARGAIAFSDCRFGRRLRTAIRETSATTGSMIARQDNGVKG